jgi:hypothetical protein
MQQYADCYGVPLSEVKKWATDYANGNVPIQVKEWMEPTKEERINSIKSYIQWQVDESVTSQIKGDLIAGRIASSESKVSGDHPCPF